VSGDEDELGEHLFNAPLPPYERTWIHPSEHARQAEQQLPARFDRSAARTLALFSVVTCLGASIGMLVVAMPGRSGAGKPAIEAATFSGGSSTVDLGISSFSSPIAAAMTESGILISVIDGAEVGERVHVATPEAAEFDAVVLDVEPDLGVTLLKVVDEPATASRIAVTRLADEAMTPGSPVWVATSAFGIELSHISPATSSRDGTHIPLEPFAASHHGGTVYTGDGVLLGWCVERDGRHWLIPANAARSAVLRLDGDVEQP
jgi:hypothetical protein